VFKNWVLMRVFEYKRDEVTGALKKCVQLEIHEFCFEPNITGMITSITMERGWREGVRWRRVPVPVLA